MALLVALLDSEWLCEFLCLVQNGCVSCSVSWIQNGSVSCSVSWIQNGSVSCSVGFRMAV